MKYILLIISSFLFASCVGTIGMHGTIVNTYSIDANQKVRLQSNKVEPVFFTITNKSEHEGILKVESGTQVFEINKDEKVKIGGVSLDGIKISNLAAQEGKYLLEIYVKGKSVDLPTAVVEE